MRIDAPTEFRRLTRIDDLKEAGETLRIEADAVERAALAERFGLIALDGLIARVLLTPRDRGIVVDAEIHMTAAVVQACVITLEPVPAKIDVVFTRAFRPHAELVDTDAGTDVCLSREDDEDPELLPSGSVDLGEVVAEQLALELDAFPRAPGVEFSGYSTQSPDESAETSGVSPFLALADWQRRRGGEA